MKRHRILIVAAHRPDRSPSQRFRFEQYLDALVDAGFDFEYSYLISETDDRLFYSPGNLRNKLFIFLKSYFKRLRDARHSSDYDIVFVQREAFMTGSTYFERRFKKSGAKLVFDFDDAIWNLDISEGNKKFGWLKNPGKTAQLIALSDCVIAGNEYLADYARRHNANVVVIPTTIDLKRYYRPQPDPQKSAVCIGWMGSHTTIKHFEIAVPVLCRLKEKYGNRVEFKVVGDPLYENKELGIRGIAWRNDREVAELATFDIGIMPLPDDEWAKGKCGLKGLQYMAMGVPPVMSPVGVNTEIITHMENGCLAYTDEEWFDCLSRLIESAEERAKLGAAALETVRTRYSSDVWKDRFTSVFRTLVK